MGSFNKVPQEKDKSSECGSCDNKENRFCQAERLGPTGWKPLGSQPCSPGKSFPAPEWKPVCEEPGNRRAIGR